MRKSNTKDSEQLIKGNDSVSSRKSFKHYKDSENHWLRSIPAHWEIKPLKNVCRAFPSNVDKKSHDGERKVLLCNYTDVYYNDIITENLDFMEATASDDQISKFSLRSGDVIFTKDSESADDIAKAAYVPNDLPGVVCGYHLSIIRTGIALSGKYIKRYFDSYPAKAYFEVHANGLTRVGLGQQAVNTLPVPLPPLPEQIQIARFLDYETARIDALIAEQQRLIELLKESERSTNPTISTQLF